MNERLFRVVAGLLAQAQGAEDPSSGITRVRAVIKKVIEGEHTISGKLHTIVESLENVIPGEKQRYQAAIRALSATSKLSRQEIVAAVNSQLDELQILEKLLIAALPHGPEELMAREARAQELRNEIMKLHEKIAQLEKEEKEMARSTAGRGTETAGIEKVMREVFADIRAEITAVKEKLEELPVESAAQPMAPDIGSRTESGAATKGSGQTSAGRTPQSAPRLQKICPLCGAQMSFSTTRKIWQCFSCAHEEPENYEDQSRSTQPVKDSIFPESTASIEPANQIESNKNEPIKAQIKDSIFPEPARNAELKQKEEKAEQKLTPEPAAGAELRQKCSMCGGRMDYYAADRKWQCYSCGFEYIRNEVQNKSQATVEKAAPGRGEEKRETSALFSIPPAESLFDPSPATKPSPGYWGEPLKRKSSFIKRLTTATKTCPSCGEKMQRRGSGKGWECSNCGYERRI